MSMTLHSKVQTAQHISPFRTYPSLSGHGSGTPHHDASATHKPIPRAINRLTPPGEVSFFKQYVIVHRRLAQKLTSRIIPQSEIHPYAKLRCGRTSL